MFAYWVSFKLPAIKPPLKLHGATTMLTSQTGDTYTYTVWRRQSKTAEKPLALLRCSAIFILCCYPGSCSNESWELSHSCVRQSRCNKADNKMSCLLTDESLLATSSIEKDQVEHTKRRKSYRYLKTCGMNLVYCCFPGITIRSCHVYWVQPNAWEGWVCFEPNSAKPTKTRTPLHLFPTP